MRIPGVTALPAGRRCCAARTDTLRKKGCSRTNVAEPVSRPRLEPVDALFTCDSEVLLPSQTSAQEFDLVGAGSADSPGKAGRAWLSMWR